jgi:hypothetical protein
MDPEGRAADDDGVIGGAVVEAVLGVAAVAQSVDVTGGLRPESVEVVVAMVAVTRDDVMLGCTAQGGQ